MAVEPRRTGDDGVAHPGHPGIAAVPRFAGHHLAGVDLVTGGADDPEVGGFLEWGRIRGHGQPRRQGHQLAVTCLLPDGLAGHESGPRFALADRHLPGFSRCLYEHAPRRGADLAHLVPAHARTGAAADALAAVLPGIAIGGLDQPQRHLLDAHSGPLNVQFLGHHHGQHGARSLADLRVLGADDDAVVRLDLDEKADLADCLAGLASLASQRERRNAQHEAASNRCAGNQETAPAMVDAFRVSHVSAPRPPVRRPCVWPASAARRCRSGRYW